MPSASIATSGAVGKSLVPHVAAPAPTALDRAIAAGYSPEIRRADPHTAFVESETTAGTYYLTTRHTCTCKAFRFGNQRDPEYRCKHMSAAHPIYCTNCGTERVDRPGAMCEGCGAVNARRAWEQDMFAVLATVPESTPAEVAESRAMWHEARAAYIAAAPAPLPLRGREELIAAGHTFEGSGTRLRIEGDPFGR